MARMGIDWVSFEGRRFPYRPEGLGEHHSLIAAAMREKVRQNPDVKNALLSTGDLVLKPGSSRGTERAGGWRYCDDPDGDSSRTPAPSLTSAVPPRG